MEKINELVLKKDKSEIDKAELHILNHTKDEKRDFEVAENNLKNAESFVRSEREKVAQLRDVKIPQLTKDYN